ncbi:uncharacterized protein LOC143000858 isoform X1 [Genypterus blacodes]|uniref:uncharacterized protein LOC143000858 isoform X1 n=1 Tax=Genypterus blacodes TaxID=154954 RepID=UPI003F766B69
MDCFTKMKSTAPFNQAMTCKNSVLDLQKVLQVMLRKGRKICQLFCSSLESLLCERFAAVLICRPLENKTSQVGLHTPPPTILIINISNSTLTDCTFGNDAYPSSVVESQPLMQESQRQMQGEMGCRGRCEQQGSANISIDPPPLPPLSAESQNVATIQISDSHLNYVIIGNNNFMHVEETV